MQPRLRRASQLAFPALFVASLALANPNSNPPPMSESTPGAPVSLYFSDVDADGLDDALAISPNGQVALLSNRGEGRFEDITLPSGLAALEGASCALFADFDGDGQVDLYVGSSEKRLWRNLGGASFLAVDSGVEHDLVDLSAEAVDYDKDGLLDLQVRTEAGDLLYRNIGKGLFERVEIAGVAAPARVVTAANASEADLDAGADPIETTPSRRRLGRWIRARHAAASANSNTTASATLLPGMTANPTGPLGLAGAPTMICAGTIVDQANGTCIEADSNGVLGKLYPLSTDFNVTPAGNVGIGTAAPTAALHVSNPASPSVRITGDDPVISLENNGAGGRNYSIYAVDGNLQLRDSFAGVPRLTIVPTGRVGIGTSFPSTTLDVAGTGSFSGNVGVGTSSPARKLHVQNGSTGVTPATNAELVVEGLTDASISLITAPNQEASIFFGNQAAGANDGAIVWNPFGGALNEGLALRTNDTNRLVIQQDGDVGIGTTSPTERLHVVGNARVSKLYADYGSSTNPTIGFVDGTQPTGFSSPAANSIAVITSGQERMRVSASGLVGIGKTPLLPLDVQGAISAGDFTAFLNHMVSSRVSASNTVVTEAIFGSNEATSGNEVGVYGRTSSASGYGVYSEGRFGATGSKSFIQPHPQDASKEVRFVCLEGNESGTYFRGSAKLVGGRCVIDVPEDFRLVSEDAGLTVQVTAVGLPAALWIESRDLERIVVRGNFDVDFDYFVNGVRRGYSDFETIGENYGYRPRVRGAPFGTQYPQEIRDMLVANGTLNPDYTPNEATAAKLGWTLVDDEQQDDAAAVLDGERR